MVSFYVIQVNLRLKGYFPQVILLRLAFELLLGVDESMLSPSDLEDLVPSLMYGIGGYSRIASLQMRPEPIGYEKFIHFNATRSVVKQ